jgi:predicted transposase YdaD
VEGKREGLVEGKREGLVEGKREGLAEALLRILTMRGVSLNPADRVRIAAEQDLDRIDLWLVRAATCTTTAELFGEP